MSARSVLSLSAAGCVRPVKEASGRRRGMCATLLSYNPTTEIDLRSDQGYMNTTRTFLDWRHTAGCLGTVNVSAGGHKHNSRGDVVLLDASPSVMIWMLDLDKSNVPHLVLRCHFLPVRR